MKTKIIGILVCMLLIATALPAVGTMNFKNDVTMLLEPEPTSTDIVWSDNFDSYNLGQYLDGGPDDGGWEAFYDNPNAGAYVVNDQFYSSPHSVEIYLSADIVHGFSGIGSGTWTYTEMVYVPTDYSYGSYIFFVSYYKFSPENWYTQFGIVFNGNDGVIEDYKTYVTLPLITDQWVEIRVEIDLEADWFECYYNDELLVANEWTDGWSYSGDEGFLNLGGIDFCWGNSPIYHDDMSLEGEASGLVPDLECDGDLSWIEVEPGTYVTGEFTVENIGDSNSMLGWVIEEYPEWGDLWAFQPRSGMLTPEDDPITVNVGVIAPEDNETEFTGEIKVVNVADPSDFEIIDVSLATPVNQQVTNPVLQMLLERFPNAFPIMRYLLGL